MPLPEPPPDPVLADILASGRFQYAVRVTASGELSDTASSVLSRLDSGLTVDGKAWLLNAVSAAISAGNAMQDLAGQDRLPADIIPKIPSMAIPGTARGDIVVLSHAIMPNAGPHGSTRGVDTATRLSIPPNKEELSEYRKMLERGIWQDSIQGGATYDDIIEIIEDVMGIYEVS